MSDETPPSADHHGYKDRVRWSPAHAIITLQKQMPPFDSNLALPALDAAARLAVAHGYIYFEAAHAVDAESVSARGLRLHRHARAGAVHFHLLQREARA